MQSVAHGDPLQFYFREAGLVSLHRYPFRSRAVFLLVSPASRKEKLGATLRTSLPMLPRYQSAVLRVQQPACWHMTSSRAGMSRFSASLMPSKSSCSAPTPIEVRNHASILAFCASVAVLMSWFRTSIGVGAEQ